MLRVVDYKTGKVDSVEKSHRRKIIASTVLPGHPGSSGSAERLHDVVVIGAGISGLTSAFWLARAGLDVGVVHRRDLLGVVDQQARRPELVREIVAAALQLRRQAAIQDHQFHGTIMLDRRLCRPRLPGSFFCFSFSIQSSRGIRPVDAAATSRESDQVLHPARSEKHGEDGSLQ